MLHEHPLYRARELDFKALAIALIVVIRISFASGLTFALVIIALIVVSRIVSFALALTFALIIIALIVMATISFIVELVRRCELSEKQ